MRRKGKEELPPVKLEPKDRPLKAPLFTYPSLPRFETGLYCAILAACMMIGWYKVYELGNSELFAKKSRTKLRKSDLWWMGDRMKDMNNFEWHYWVIWIRKALPFYCMHSLLYNGLAEHMSTALWRVSMFSYWIFATCCLFPINIILCTYSVCIIMFLIAKYLRSKLLLWIFIMAFLYVVVEGILYIKIADLFESTSFVGYKMVHCLTFCITYIDSHGRNGRGGPLLDELLEMMWYLMYFPYQLSLIIIYPKFRWQYETRKDRVRNWLQIVWFGCRMVFWFYFIEVSLHYLYFESALTDKSLLDSVDLLTLSSLGQVVGQFFYLKYVVIFGFPSLFAKMDNMVPLDPPICINAVSLFSQLWRHFDRGLYDFFKEYIFLPICQPTFSTSRRFAAMLMCFFFVLFWHGMRHNCIIWILLNIIEILLESIAKYLYSISSVKQWREGHISDRNFRRILAGLQLFPLAMGYYSNFYFLGGSTFGGVLVDRIFWGETFPRLRLPAILLLSLGYCYNNVGMDAEIRRRIRS